MLKSKKFRKIAGSWLKVVVWFVVLAAVVAIQSGAFKASDAEASIEITATVNDPVVDKVLPSTGPVGGNVRVSISGTNFTNVIAVTFGGVNVQSFTTLSDSLISAVTPPGQAGPVRVVVITEDKAGALDNGFTYGAQATPTSAPTPTATATTGPLTLAATPTGTSDTAAPATPTPAGEQLTATPGGSITPRQTSAPVTVSTTPAATLTTTPEGTPVLSTTTIATTTTPTETALTATPTPSLNPVVTSNATPESSATPGPTATVARATTTPEENSSTSTPAVTATITPGSPFISPTPAITGSGQTVSATVTPAATVQPSQTPVATSPTPATTTPLPTATANSVPATISATPVIDVTPTAIVAPTATPELTVTATPTAILAPTPTPAGSPEPSPTAAPVAPPIITQVSPDQGTITGGTTVTITGSNFSPDTEVTFGGLAPASVIINSPTLITVVTAPQQAGPVSIVVKNGAGLASLTNGFTYTATADSVVISQQPTNFNYSGKLNGKTLILKSSFSVGVRVTGPNLAGWRLVARSTVLSSGATSLPVNSHTIQNVRVVSNDGIAPDNDIRYPMTFPVNNATIFAAAPGTGTGETILTFETQLVIPPGIPAGNYKLSLNVDVVSGDVS